MDKSKRRKPLFSSQEQSSILFSRFETPDGPGGFPGRKEQIEATQPLKFLATHVHVPAAENQWQPNFEGLPSR